MTTMATASDELVFAPLGGLGEIGMNAALYGYGPKDRKRWILVDCGMGFGNEEHLPGIDVIYPDLRFVREERANLTGIFITHAHEDHIGAVADLWPGLRVPVYGTKFSLSLLETRKLSEQGAPKVDLREVFPGRRIQSGPFEIEYIPVAHSIPEAHALAIRTPAGLVLHTGDWKIDPNPYVGDITSEERFRALGDEGVLALICDSTNVVREGRSPSETDVARCLADLIAQASGRVAVTTFASNVARIKAVLDASSACGRTVVAVGRAMERVIDVARECGYLPDAAGIRFADSYARLPRDKTVVLLTGSQGEPRAALARVADNEHPDIKLSPGDTVIFSARTIPGNERTVGRIVNRLIEQKVEIVNDQTALVHVSGHPRRDELADMYRWTRPKIAVPAHGEMLHLSRHAAFAKEQGVGEVVIARNGNMVRLAPGEAGIVDDMPSGRLYKDGNLIIDGNDAAIAERRKLSFSGIVSVAVAIDDKGGIAGDPVIDLKGLPDKTTKGEDMADFIADIVMDALEGLPGKRRRDPETVENVLVRAVRGSVNAVWGKKPSCHVLVIEV